MTRKRTHRIDGTVRQLNRRHFLLGAGGFALSIPFLESLDQEAHAGVPPYAANPRFVAMSTGHGAVWPDNMFPLDNTTPNTFDVAPGHTIHHGDLQLTTSSGVSSLSPVLSADSSVLTASLASKMMVIRGLDVMWYIGHNAGGALGNYRAHNGDTPVGMVHRPTIDQVMAWSPSFYPDLQNVLARSMHIGKTLGGGLSWGYANPATQSGGVNSIPTSQSSQALFNQIFVPPTDPSVQQRPLVVDRVVESYRRLRDGVWGASARLSAADRQKLDDQMERFLEVERKLGVAVDCGSINVPTDEAHNYANGSADQDVSELTKKYQLYNDVIASAFICGTSKIATVLPPDRWYDNFSGIWHEVAHSATGSAAQSKMVASHNNFFKAVFLDLCNKLDVDEGNGTTVLDNSLIMWAQECGELTHWSASVPVVTAGSAAGYFNTGKCYDYRNRNNLELAMNNNFLAQQIRPGLSYNQWLANVLQSANIPPSEFAWPGETGYGDPHRGPIKYGCDPLVTHPDYVVADMNAPLPFIKA